MSDARLTDALNRAEQALDRIARAAERQSSATGRDEALRAKVAGIVAELDDLIRSAGSAA